MSLAKKLFFFSKNFTWTLGVLEGGVLIVIGFVFVILGTSIPMLDALDLGGLIGGGVMMAGAVLCRFCYLQMDPWFFSHTRWEIYRAKFLARVIAITCFLGSVGFLLAGVSGTAPLFFFALIAFVYDRYLAHETKRFIAQHHRF